MEVAVVDIRQVAALKAFAERDVNTGMLPIVRINCWGSALDLSDAGYNTAATSFQHCSERPDSIVYEIFQGQLRDYQLIKKESTTLNYFNANKRSSVEQGSNN
jgi:hypothetical protein